MSNLTPSSIVAKTPLVSGITPVNNASLYPTHYADFGYGGLRSVTSIAARDAIPTDRRDTGMMAYVISSDEYYKLEGGIDNSNWALLAFQGDTVGLTEIAFTVSDWTETNAPTGAIVVDILHNLNQTNIAVHWFEGGSDGPVFVPWESIDANTIRGCIPKGSFDSTSDPVDTGNAFLGDVRIVAFVEPENTSNVEGARFEFSASTTGTNPNWVETGTGSGIFSLIIDHGLGTNAVKFTYLIDNKIPNIIEPTTISTTQLIIQSPEEYVFAGSVFITKVT